MKKRNIILFSFLSISFSASAQNLISNGSFEIFPEHSYPSGFREVAPTTWVFINSVDIYLSSDKERYCKLSQPSAQDGNVYLGLICYSVGNPNYREYVLVLINKPLIKGHHYKVSFYLQYSCTSPILIDDIHVFFLNDKVRFPNNERNSFTDTVKVISIPINNKYLEKWNLISDTIIANGDEAEIGFGNLNKDKDVRFDKLKNSSCSSAKYCTSAYVFLDNVSLVPLDSENVSDEIISPVNSSNIIKINTIRFLFNDTTILTEYSDTMELLIDTLKESQLIVKLIGYTDSIGNYNYNLSLSRKRANAIKNTLIKNGISSNRIIVDYKSYMNPLKSNEMESERSMNRRVEIILMDSR